MNSSNLYQETILDELKNPQNYGELPDADVVVEETNASCGDEVTVFIKTDDTGYSILDIRWTGVGCAISQASMSLLSEKIKGMSIAEIQNLSKEEMEELVGVDQISVGRVKCLMLGLKAVQKALNLLTINN